MGKDKLKDRPKFIYYRLLRGIQNLFASVKRLFSFRLKKEQREKLKEEILKTMPLFGKISFSDMWIEEVA